MKIYGDYHMHVKVCRFDRSDAHDSVLEMAEQAKIRGLKEIAITSHGRGSFWNGTSRRVITKIRKQAKEAEEKTGVRVLVGIEANILSVSGKIGYSKKEQKEFDIVLAGVHQTTGYSLRRMAFGWLSGKKGIQRNTQTIINTIKNNHIDALSHPGRYCKIDYVAVANACAEHNVLFELNRKQRVGFFVPPVKQVLHTGVKFILNSDAHRARDVGNFDDYIEFLDDTVPKEQIVNANEDFVWERFRKK